MWIARRQAYFIFIFIHIISVQAEERRGQFELKFQPEIGLYPSVVNLAARSEISANATCGTLEREEYCKLVEHSHRRRISFKGNCGYCDAESNIESETHPISSAVDGRGDKWWQSPSISNGYQYHWVTITLDLKQVFQTAYVILKAANSPRPGNWILERSLDGVTYTPWQYFAIHQRDCLALYGVMGTNLGAPRLLHDNEVICTTYFSKLLPLENGEIHISLINGRPSAFSPSSELIEFTSARFIRIRMQRIRTLNADLMVLGTSKANDPSVTNRYFYSLKDISIGGMCICYGHASECLSDETTGQFRCQCSHNTAGESCEQCAPMYNQIPWRPGSNGFECEECNCNGHASTCYYDKEVATEKQSMNTRGQYIGGGVCKSCQDLTEGINCDSCIDGYYRPLGVSPRVGRPCVACDCDFRGSQIFSNGRFYCRKTALDLLVDSGPNPGDCVCKKGYTGAKCDRCDTGYTGFPTCEPCACSLAGSLNFDPCAGVCQCKTHVTGKNCDICKGGYFNLQSTNRDGCQTCYCSGATRACRKAELYRIEVDALSGWKVKTRTGSRSANVQVNMSNKTLTVYHQNALGSLNTPIYYWSAPEQYLGNLLTSYGGNLRYSLQYDITDDAASSPLQDIDVLIKGRATTLIYQNMQQRRLEDGEIYHISIPMLAEMGWMDTYSRQPVNRGQMLSLLSDVKSILIRAVYNRHPLATYRIFNISLDSASPTSGSESVHSVEMCHCPVGYTGLSCEDCATGFYRFGKSCKRCECHGHSTSCNLMTGACEYCQHNTMGKNCERCMIGYYGDAMKGTPYDCNKCACPLEVSSNNFSPTCMLDELDGQVRCLECPIGHRGDKCESCIEGYFGNPLQIGDICKPCHCNSNSRKCDSEGKCLNCLFNTIGDHCEKCAPGFYGSPVNGGVCQSCKCSKLGAASQNCNQETGQCECLGNLKGLKCEECEIGYYLSTEFASCVMCNCDKVGSIDGTCNSDGSCRCKPGVTGPHCNQCSFGYYGLNQQGCKECKCEFTGGNCNALTGQCICPPYTTGASCSQCIETAYNWDKEKGCQLCNCSPEGAKSNYCDVRTGKCECKREFAGLQCDQCKSGYFNYPICSACFCSSAGTESTSCNDDEDDVGYGAECGCDQRNGKCTCKINVEGQHCDRCVAGSFSLTAGNPDGCTSCYCSGVTDKCAQANFVWGKQVSLSVNPLRVSVSNKVNTRSTKEGIMANNDGSVEIDVRVVRQAMRSEPYYWRLPQEFTGDQLLSYGGNLYFSIYYNAQGPSSPATRSAPLVVLRGKGFNVKDISYHSNEPINHETTSFVVSMTEHNWHYLDTNITVTRKDFANVLKNIEIFLIRASYGTLLDQTRLSSVYLDSAVYGTPGRGDSSTSGDVAIGVEQCICPEGYVGMSCQDCDYGYTRTSDNLCVPCNCNNKSDSCNVVTGKCYLCKDNFAGDNCDRCITGYYLTSALECLKCACPLENIENNFSPTCHSIGSDGLDGYICDNCPVGYEGDHCEKCSEGYFGNPSLPGGYCRRCSCNSAGSTGQTCDNITGQCQCKPGITGLVCDQCKPRHVITEEGCLVCGDECSGKLIVEMEFMLQRLKPIDTTFLFPPPWDKLNGLKYDAEELQQTLSKRNITNSQFQGLFRVLPDMINILDGNITSLQTKAQTCYLTSDDLVYKVNKHQKNIDMKYDQLMDVHSNTQGLNSDISSLINNMQNGTLVGITTAEKIVTNLMEELNDRDLNKLKIKADAEKQSSRLLMKDIATKFTNPASSISSEYNETKTFVSEQLDDVFVRLNDLFSITINTSSQVQDVMKNNANNSMNFDNLQDSVNDLENTTSTVILTQDQALDLVDETKKLINSGRNEIAKETQLKDKLSGMYSQMSTVADKVVGTDLQQLWMLVKSADQKANQLSDHSNYFKQLLEDTSGRVYNETEAALRYGKITSAVNMANASASSALKLAMDALANGDLMEKSTSALKQSNQLLDEIEQYSEIIKGDSRRLAQYKNDSKYAKSKLKELSRPTKRFEKRLKRIKETESPDLTEVLTKASGAMEIVNNIQNNITQAEETVNDLRQTEEVITQQGNTITTIREDVDNVPTLLTKTSSTVYESMKSQDRIDLLSDQVKEKIKDIRKLIEESRKKAASIRTASVKSEGKCYMRYQPEISPSLRTDIILHVISKQPDNMLFLLSKNRTSNGMGDFLAVESINGRVNVTLDLGNGAMSVVNPLIITEKPKIENDWYKIKINRVAREMNVTVIRMSDMTTESVPMSYTLGKSSHLDINDRDVMFVGGLKENIKDQIGLNHHEFTGCMGQAKLQGHAVGLWDFREISALEFCSSCTASPSGSSDSSNAYHFDGESYVVLARHQLFIPQVTNINFAFKTFSNDGLLLYQASVSNGDFISLELVDGYLLLQMDIGNGINMIKTTGKYNTGTWVTASILRSEGRVQMKAMSRQVEKYELSIKGSDGKLDIEPTDIMTVGGYPPNVVARPGVTKTYFIGCIKSLLIYNRQQPLTGGSDRILRILGVKMGCPTEVRYNVGISENGYVELPGTDLTHDRMISLTFNTKRENVVLLLAVNQMKSGRRRRRKRQTDKSFYSLSLIGGRIHAWLHSSDGHRLNLTSKMSYYSNGYEHSIKLKRKMESVSLIVNDGVDMTTGVIKIANHPIKSNVMYVGGVPDVTVVIGTTPTNQSLDGCIRELTTKKPVNFLTATHAVGAHLGNCQPTVHDEVVMPTVAMPTTSDRNLTTRSTVTMPSISIVTTPNAITTPKVRVYPECAARPTYPYETNAVHFGKSLNSHLQFAFNKKISNKSRFELSLRTFDTDGLLLYCGHDNFRDRISLHMQDGIPTFQFDAGAGPAVINGTRRINDGEWHKIKIVRTKRKGSLYVDGIKQGTTRSPKGQTQLNVLGILYLGGVPQSIQAEKGLPSSMDVCIKDLYMGKNTRLDMNKALLMHEVEKCAEKIQHGVQFNGNGFAVFREEYRVGTTIVVEFEFRTWASEAVLISVSSKPSQNDGVALEIVNGSITFRANNGDENFETTYNSPEKFEGGKLVKQQICDGKWHRIRASKVRNKLSLSVDFSSAPSVESSASTFSADTENPLYIGGLADNASTQAQLTTAVGFDGCMRNIKFDGQKINFEKLRRKNVFPNSCPGKKVENRKRST